MSKSHPGLPIPDDWNGVNWRRFSICWPDSPQWRQILGGFITTTALGRAWDEATGTIVDVQAIGRDIVNFNFPWRYVLVATCDEGLTLSNAIRYLADRLADKPCCGSGTPGTPGGPGTGGTGTTPQEPAPPVDTEGPPPEGYDTWVEYADDVCAKATWLVNTIYDDITRMSLLQLVGASLVTMLPILAALLLDPIPGDELLALAALLIAIAAYGSSTLNQVKTSFNDAITDLICALYSANGAVAGKAAVLDVFRTQIEGDTTDPVQIEYGVQLVGIMFSSDGLNKVYEKQEGIEYPAGDCSGCNECEGWNFIRLIDGEIVGQTLGETQAEYVIESRDVGGFQGITLAVKYQCGFQFNVVSVALDYGALNIVDYINDQDQIIAAPPNSDYNYIPVTVDPCVNQIRWFNDGSINLDSRITIVIEKCAP